MRLTLASILLIAIPVPALACLPPPPGYVEPPLPTHEELATWIATSSDNIVYGVLTRGTDESRPAQLRIVHVYKGDLPVGVDITVRPGWGFDPPPHCSGMLSPPPWGRGRYGVFAWSGEPELNAVYGDVLSAMFKLQLIRSAKKK